MELIRHRLRLVEVSQKWVFLRINGEGSLGNRPTPTPLRIFALMLTYPPLKLAENLKVGINLSIDQDLVTVMELQQGALGDGGNLSVEFTIEAPNVQGVAQVFSPEVAFGVYPLQ